MRHHYIPKWLLRNFLDSGGKIYGFVKSNPSGGVFPATPNDLMVQGNLYALTRPSGSVTQEIEEWLSGHDARSKLVTTKIIDAARNNMQPRLTPEEKTFFLQFYLLIWRRTPDAEAKNLPGPDIDAFVDSWAEEHDLDADEKEAARQRLHDPDNQKIMTHNAQAMASVHPPSAEVIELFESRGLKVARISRPNKSFVIGSYPVARVNHHREAHIWLPIAHDVAVTPFGPPESIALVELAKDRDIRAINEASFRQSSIVAARSKQLLHSLANGLGYAR